MVELCSNRPEGFGPRSRLHPSLPTTCFLDVLVIPLVTILYLIVILVFIPKLANGTHRKVAASVQDEKAWLSRPRGEKLRITLRVLYYFFLVALLAMASLEIARLEDAQLGIGMLPFIYPGLLFAAGSHFLANRGLIVETTTTKLARLTNFIYWLLFVVVFTIKTATLGEEGAGSRDGREPIDRYKVADQVTDLGVMIFLVLVLAVLELFAS